VAAVITVLKLAWLAIRQVRHQAKVIMAVAQIAVAMAQAAVAVHLLLAQMAHRALLSLLVMGALEPQILVAVLRLLMLAAVAAGNIYFLVFQRRLEQAVQAVVVMVVRA
jgi:hypothetical protein